MRAYLAIILDSFREATVSRTLWILLIPITLLLLALIPVGVLEQSPTILVGDDLQTPIKLLRWIKDEATADEISPGKHIWKLTKASEQKELDDLLASDDSREQQFVGPRVIRGILNRLLTQPAFYDAEHWKDIELDKETQELVDRNVKELSKTEIQRRNRLLLTAAYPDFLTSTGSRVVISYFGAELTPPLPVGGQSVRNIISEAIIPTITSLLIGVIAVFVAVVVTSPVIPQLFDPGSLSLLFSKPTYRSLAFLAKFVGGCSFILLSAAYLNIGMWLIFGLRFDIWNTGWWTTIPVFLFLFAVYYSVSAAAGVIWRNAIVAVACAMTLWLLGFVDTLTKNIYEQIAITPNEIVGVYASGDEVFATTQSASLIHWNSNTQDWVELSSGLAINLHSFIGPVDIETKDGRRVLLSRRMRRSGFPEQLNLEVLAPDSDRWDSTEGVRLPFGTISLLQTPQKTVIAVTNDGVYRLNRFTSDKETGSISTGFFLKLPRFGKPAAEPIGPDNWNLQGPSWVDIDNKTGDLAVYDAGEVSVFAQQVSGDYEFKQRIRIIDGNELGGAIAIAGKTIVCILVDGRVIELDASSLKVRNRYQAESSSQPRAVTASPDGETFAIAYHNHTLHLLTPKSDSHAGTFTRPKYVPQNKTMAAVFNSKGELLIAHGHRGFSRVDLKKQTILTTNTPPLRLYEKIFFYAIRPIDMVVPKPGDLKNTATYLITKKETSDGGLNQRDIEAYRPPIDPWQPVYTSGIFLIIMLGLTCIYIERQDY